MVKNIARKENISNDELERIQGSGKNNRVTKNDILSYIKTKDSLVNEEKKNQPILNTQVEKNSNLISIWFNWKFFNCCTFMSAST